MDHKNIEYRKATMEDVQIVCDIVQRTKAVIYPHFYTQAVVDFFGRLHSIDNIKRDIGEGIRLYDNGTSGKGYFFGI